MPIEITLIILGLALAACYVVLEYQKLAKPPYQEPLEDQLEPTELNPQATWPFPHGDKP